MDRIIRVHIFLDSLSTFLPLQAKKTECCVSGTPTTPKPPYLILSTSHVLTPGDTSSTTTTELTNRFLMGILRPLTTIFVKLKCMVRYWFYVSVKRAEKRRHWWTGLNERLKISISYSAMLKNKMVWRETIQIFRKHPPPPQKKRTESRVI